MQRTVLALGLAIVFATSHVSAIAFEEAPEQTIPSLLAEARVAQSKGDFGAAAKLYQRAVAIDPSVAELWANLGLMYHELGKSTEAIESLTRAARLNPSLFVPQLFLGLEYLAAKNAPLALPFLQRATKLNPDDSLAQLSLGRALEMLDRADQAALAYEKATAIAPGNGSAWLSLGTAYLQQVENDARLMTSRYRNSPYYNLRAAETLAEQGKLVQAESAYKAVLASLSPPPCAHAEFGITLLHENRVPEAREQFQLEANGHPHCGLALLGIAVADLAEGHPDTALKEFTAIAARDFGFLQSSLPLFRGTISSDRARPLLDLAQAQHDSGDLPNKVASLVEQAFFSDVPSAISNSFESGLSNTKPPVSVAEADGLIATDQYAACDRALKADLHSLTSSQQQLLAFCAFYEGDFRTTLTAAGLLNANSETKAQGLYWESKADQKLAVVALNRAGEIEPDSARMNVLIGNAYRQKRRWSEAEAVYRRAVAIDPKSRSARLSLAIVLFTELKSSESFQIDQSLLTEAPDDPEANLLAGEILVQENQLEKAEPFLLKCRNISGDFALHLHVLLGQVYAGTGRVPAAIDEYKQGLATDENGSTHYQLGRLYLKVGNKTSAEEAFKESRRLVKRWNDSAQVASEHIDSDVSRQ